jgi:hypothetical protein
MRWSADETQSSNHSSMRCLLRVRTVFRIRTYIQGLQLSFSTPGVLLVVSPTALQLRSPLGRVLVLLDQQVKITNIEAVLTLNPDQGDLPHVEE